MYKKRFLKIISVLTIFLVSSSATLVKGAEGQSAESTELIYSAKEYTKGIATNKLNYYVLNEKEVQGVLGNFSEEIEELKLSSGYYVFNNEKYGIKDSNVYVLISLGKRNTAGSGINVNSVEDIEGISKITIEETKPAIDALVAQIVTYPYVIVRFSQGTPNVRVVTETGNEISSIANSSEATEKGWIRLKTYENVVNDKEWFITFKRDIYLEAIHDGNIYVRDSSGKKIAVELSVGENKNSIRVIPVEKYSSGETYYLFITKNVENKISPQSRIKGYRMMFTIKS